jgi:DNA-binding MarR family transcriptional regulator
MQLNEKQLQVLKAVYEDNTSEEKLHEVLGWSIILISYYLEELEKQNYVKVARSRDTSGNHPTGNKVIFVRILEKGIVTIENPEDLIQSNSTIPMTNNISISGSVNSPINILQNADNNNVTINQNIDQNVAEIIKSLDFLQKEIQTFPENQKEIATVHLDDLREEITTEERRNSKKIKAYFMAFLGIALPLLGYVANTTDFVNNLTDLGEKFNIEIPKLGEIIQESELTQEESVKLADEINQSAWQQLKPQTLK